MAAYSVCRHDDLGHVAETIAGGPQQFYAVTAVRYTFFFSRHR